MIDVFCHSFMLTRLIDCSSRKKLTRLTYQISPFALPLLDNQDTLCRGHREVRAGTSSKKVRSRSTAHTPGSMQISYAGLRAHHEHAIKEIEH